MLKCTELLCEYLKDPVGIDTAVPRFSWKLDSDMCNVMQTAYEIKIDGMWETGKTESGQSVNILYGGKPLEACTRYYYSVRVWDNYGYVSGFEKGSFETGLMKPENWKTEWIGTQEHDVKCIPVFRKEFVLPAEEMKQYTYESRKIKKARIYATALGSYEIELNGQRVGDEWLAPGFTSYNKHLLYQTYDVTSMLKCQNVICVTLGSGWCHSRISKSVFKCDLALLMQMYVEFDDGTVINIYTDDTWKYTGSPFIMSDIYDGETYDATRQISGSDIFGFDDTEWKRAETISYDKSHISAQIHEPVRIIEKIKPVKIIKTPANETVIDFGQNMVGWAAFNVAGKLGDRVIFDHAEVLDRDGNFYTENMRSAKNIVEYVLSGNGTESYHPHFTFQGFRYIRVLSFPCEVTLEHFEGLVIHSGITRTGSFECSNQDVNQLFCNIIWGQRGNFVDIPTDCPQRDERLGWTGDAQVFVRTAALNYNVYNFFAKWLFDLWCDQDENGGVPSFIPKTMPGERRSSAWGDAACICPWELYKAYGDSSILKVQYNSMKKWVEFIYEQICAQGGNPYIWNTGSHYGDWLGLDAQQGSYVGATSKDFIATVFYANSTDILVKTAKLLGYAADAEKYQKLYENIIEAFRYEFVTPSGRLSENTQTAYSIALYFNMVKDRKRAASHLAKLVTENGGKLTTGFVGTPYLCHALSENGYADLAFGLLLQTEYPSWIYSIRQGATTIWEHWDGIRPDGSFWSAKMNSYNHYAYGAIGDWMYTKIAGINYDEGDPGYKHIVFKPYYDKRLAFSKASIISMYGGISAGWEKCGDGSVKYDIKVPHNTTATVVLPDGKVSEAGSGSHSYSFAP